MAMPPNTQQLRSSFQKMTDVVVLLSRTALPHRAVFLPLLRTHQEAIISASHHTSPEHKGEHRALIVADFSVCLAAVALQLARLSTRLVSATAYIAGTTEEEVFWELWQCLITCCLPFCPATKNWINLCSHDQPCIPLYSTFYGLLTWLQMISRSPTWLAMTDKHGLKRRNCDLLVILAQMTDLLDSITNSPPLALAAHLKLLHPNFMPLLCCIVSEQFTDIPMLVLHTITGATADRYSFVAMSYTSTHESCSPCITVMELLSGIVSAIYNLLIHANTHGNLLQDNNSKLSFLTTPAVLHFLKACLLSRQAALPSGQDLMLSSMASLDVLLQHCLLNPRDLPPNIRFTANRDEVGLPLHSNPLLSTQALHTDRMLLHVVGSHIAQHRGGLEHMESCLTVQAMILQTWKHATFFYPSHAEAVSSMVDSVIGLAKQYTVIGLQLMRSLRKNTHTAPQHSSQEATQGARGLLRPLQQRLQNQPRKASRTCPSGSSTIPQQQRPAMCSAKGILSLRDLTSLTSELSAPWEVDRQVLGDKVRQYGGECQVFFPHALHLCRFV